MGADGSDGAYTMYGAEFSLYSGKLRSYLRHKGIPFREKTATARRYRKFIQPRTGVRFIPVLHTPDDQVWQDTSVIIDLLETRHPRPAMLPATPAQKVVALIAELLGDEWLLMPAMHYRWNFPENHRFLFGEFGSMLFPALPAPLRRWAGKRVGLRFAGFLPMLGITEDTARAIEERYERLLDDLNKHFSEHDFLLGSRPSIGDFGFIGPFYAHLYRDPYPGRLMRERAPAVHAWVERMMAPTPGEGQFLPDDEIPSTLLRALQPLCEDYLPILAATLDALERRLAGSGEGKLPRTIGRHTFNIDGAHAERMIFPYPVWMLQRARDTWSSLSTGERASAAPVLRRLGALEILERASGIRVVRRDNRNILEAATPAAFASTGCPARSNMCGGVPVSRDSQ